MSNVITLELIQKCIAALKENGVSAPYVAALCESDAIKFAAMMNGTLRARPGQRQMIGDVDVYVCEDMKLPEPTK